MSTEKHKKEEGKYIYCVIDSPEERDFGNMGIGGREDLVHSVCYKDIAIVVSDSPIKKYNISRESIITHQKSMEMLMKDYTILPVKFGTVAGGKEGIDVAQRLRSEVLKARYEELKGLLAKMENKVELGLKAIWLDMKIMILTPIAILRIRGINTENKPPKDEISCLPDGYDETKEQGGDAVGYRTP